MKTWKKKLTKKELRHIAETTDNCLLREFTENRRWHNKEKADGRDDPCLECRHIAVKLGIET